MYDPKEILTESGFEDYKHHLYNINKGLNFILIHASDLNIGSLDEKQLETLYDMQNLLPLLKSGDEPLSEELIESFEALQKLKEKRNATCCCSNGIGPGVGVGVGVGVGLCPVHDK